MTKSNVYTRTGDHGQTSLVGGQRVDKDCVRLESYGTIDELNSHLGLLSAMISGMRQQLPAPDADELAAIGRTLLALQNHLFVVGSYLATDSATTQLRSASIVTPEMVSTLEHQIDALDASLPPLRAFVLPGGNMAAAQCHVCRTVCRRAERRIVALSRETEVDAAVGTYINRLSDFLFVLARKLNIMAGEAEILWENMK